MIELRKAASGNYTVRPVLYVERENIIDHAKDVCLDNNIEDWKLECMSDPSFRNKEMRIRGYQNNKEIKVYFRVY